MPIGYCAELSEQRRANFRESWRQEGDQQATMYNAKRATTGEFQGVVATKGGSIGYCTMTIGYCTELSEQRRAIFGELWRQKGDQ